MSFLPGGTNLEDGAAIRFADNVRRQFHDFHRLDPHLSRGLCLQCLDEFRNAGHRPKDLHPHGACFVLHPAAQSALAGRTANERAEADTLNDAARNDRHTAPFQLWIRSKRHGMIFVLRSAAQSTSMQLVISSPVGTVMAACWASCLQ